jgi:hypothetical protein
VLDRFPSTVQTYIQIIAIYLKTNVERNVKLLESLECLVLLHRRLPFPFKRSFSELLEHKYRCVDLRADMSKLQAVNEALIEPFLGLLTKLAEWHQLEA